MAYYEEGKVNSAANNAYDAEYNSSPKTHQSSIILEASAAVPGNAFIHGDGLYARLQRMVSRFGVEARGIEPVPQDERTDKLTMKFGTMKRNWHEWAAPVP